MTKVHQQRTQTLKQEKQQTVLSLFPYEINTFSCYLQRHFAKLTTSPEINN